MKKGDIVRVRTKDRPEQVRVGIVISTPKKMYMVGSVAEVMVDGSIKRVKEEHVEKIIIGDQADES